MPRTVQSSAFKSFISALVLVKRLPFPASSSAIALRVAAFGALISKGRRRSSAIRNISRRIASEMDSPIAARASAARSLVVLSMRARTYVSALLILILPQSPVSDLLRSGPYFRSLWKLYEPRGAGPRPAKAPFGPELGRSGTCPTGSHKFLDLRRSESSFYRSHNVTTGQGTFQPTKEDIMLDLPGLLGPLRFAIAE